MYNSTPISIDSDYTGFVIFYKKSKDATIAEIQSALYSKLIENALKLKLQNFLFIDINEQKVRFSVLKKSTNIQKCFLCMPKTMMRRHLRIKMAENMNYLMKKRCTCWSEKVIRKELYHWHERETMKCERRIAW